MSNCLDAIWLLLLPGEDPDGLEVGMAVLVHRLELGALQGAGTHLSDWRIGGLIRSIWRGFVARCIS